MSCLAFNSRGCLWVVLGVMCQNNSYTHALLWVDAQNVALISIASVMDPSLAPPGKHTLHAYLPATEPWSLWEGGTWVLSCSPQLQCVPRGLSPWPVN